MKVLTYTVATDADGTVVYHSVPEEAGGMIPFGSMIPVFIILCKVGDTFVADNLRYLCVGMHACQAVFILHKRVQNQFMGEAACQFQVFLVTCDFGNISESFVQSAMFTAEHVLHLLVGEFGGDVYHPVGEGN